MAGIDFMTIAAWLGHKDGGILIGKVYGHLLDEHRQKMAAKLTIGLAPIPVLCDLREGWHLGRFDIFALRCPMRSFRLSER